MKKTTNFPPEWDEGRVRRLLQHYESQTEEEMVAEDEAAFEDPTQTVMEIPNELVPSVRALLSKHAESRSDSMAYQQGWQVVLMIPFHRCPVWGEKLFPSRSKSSSPWRCYCSVSPGKSVALLRATVLSRDRLFEQIRHKLTNQDVEEFEPLGRAFQVPGC